MLIWALILLLFDPWEPEPEFTPEAVQRARHEALVIQRKLLRKARIERHKKAIQDLREHPEVHKRYLRLRRRLALGDPEIIELEEIRRIREADYRAAAGNIARRFEKPDPRRPLTLQDVEELENAERGLSFHQPEHYWYRQAVGVS